MIGVATRKPVNAIAAKYDGSIAQINYLVNLVQNTNGGRQKLYPEDESGLLVLQGPDGTFDLKEGWWLVFDRNVFEVLTPEEFDESYEMKEQG